MTKKESDLPPAVHIIGGSGNTFTDFNIKHIPGAPGYVIEDTVNSTFTRFRLNDVSPEELQSILSLLDQLPSSVSIDALKAKAKDEISSLPDGGNTYEKAEKARSIIRLLRDISALSTEAMPIVKQCIHHITNWLS